jgi:translation initiation factor 2D
MVVLDDVLIKALGLPASQQTLGRDKMVPTLAASCSPFHIIAPEGQEGNMKPAKGPVPKIVIATERRGGHKVVTLISGLEPFHIDPDTFFEKLRVACAGSGSVNQIRSDSDLKVVMIQGNQATQVTKLLEKQGIRSGWIDVKTKK